MKPFAIPDDVLVPRLSAITESLGKCCDNFALQDFEQLRRMCGKMFSSVPLDDLRRRCANLRMRGQIKRIR